GRVHHCPSPIIHQAGAAVPSTCSLLLSDIRRARRLDVVWTRAPRLVPALSFLCRSHLEGSQAGRSSGSAADEVRTGHQSQDRQRARPPNFRQVARACRRGHRMTAKMKRRDFITLLGGATMAWPLAARAQQGERMRRVGVLISYVESDSEAQQQARAFSQSLEALGWSHGSNITLDYRWRSPPPEQLQDPAVKLVQLNPDVLLAGATPAAIALKNATRSIPIVFANVADPVGQGFVASLGQPSGNMSGFGAFEFSIAGKWVQGLKEFVPAATEIGVIVNPETAPFFGKFLPFIDTAARLAGIKPNITEVHDPAQISGTIDKLARE